ncbi:MAG: HDIG domain-containing protein [Spirochaetaceae bacterium]|jgi:putative nucleotidyltransferase with HDIG domain|nr:HDIG domain-containing protein [Spirochaetaceae bacterium]
MIMKKNNDALEGSVFLKSLKPPRPRLGAALATGAASLVLVVTVIIGSGGRQADFSGDLDEFAAGKVAERDVAAEQPLSFVDEEATRLRLDAQERLVPAVFKYNHTVAAEMREDYNRFTTLILRFFREEGISLEAFQFAIHAEFPGIFSNVTLGALFQAPDREGFPEYGSITLEHLIETGIFALPERGLEIYNPDVVELLHNSGSRTERERIRFDRLTTKANFRDAANRFIIGENYPKPFDSIAADLLSPFVKENVFFSPEDTKQRLEELNARLEPVIREIQRGDRIIRKGFVITEEDMVKLRALHMTLSVREPRIIIARILILLMLYGLFAFLMGRRTIGRILTLPEVYFLSSLTAVYFITAFLLRGINFSIRDFPSVILLPTALMVMLPSILISSRIAIILSLLLPLGAFLSGVFDTSSYILALCSGVVASYSLRGVERRMDLIMAGFIVAGANCVATAAILLLQRTPPSDYPFILLSGAFNGIVSGMLVLGFLPPLEHVLNAVTVFRLIELSDLNAPILKRLLTTAPGTYSHSVMVGNLAETACQDIGANALLARVGAYYHDIGKIEQPDYFVENQTVYNKHDDIAPRLSATVIRSHVKLGVEKARLLGLPREVTDIIAEHHGNSVISWFYNEALKREGADSKSAVNMEDFTYPGKPPRSRESAVVMLADVTEAATRTLKKPSPARLEKFIQELIMNKVEHGQLSESELTFRDLETIKNAFVRVLAGYYHSRIEYPKLPREAPVSNGNRLPEGGAP